MSIPWFTLYTLVVGFLILKMFFRSKNWDPKSKTCFVTGGSQGLGLSMAILLAQNGANVTIVARDEQKLVRALEEIEKHRQSPDQIFRYRSYTLHTAEGASAAIEAECEASNGRAPDAFFLCAGTSRPYFYVENTSEDLINGMNQAFWVQAWPAHVATQKLVQQKKKGKIVFVSSTCSILGMVGYTSYAPGKAALRSLADTLKSEFNLYDIDVHIFLAGTILSPGFEIEQTYKPEITKKLEEDDSVATPDQAAKILLQGKFSNYTIIFVLRFDSICIGVERGHYQICSNFITSVFRASTRSSSPSAHAIQDFFLDLLAWIVVPIWRMYADRTIKNHRKEHEAHLLEKKFYKKNTV